MYIYICIYIYIYICVRVCVCVCIYTFMSIHTWKPSLLRAAIPTHGDTRACARPHICAHTRARASAVAAAHNGPRRIDDPAERVPPAVARRPGRRGGANPGQVGDTRGVPRADVRDERRRLHECLRAEPRAVDADARRSHVSARIRARPSLAHSHTRARMDAASEHMCAAGRHRRSVHRFSQPRMDIDTCMHWVYVHCVCACLIDGWRYEESASHSHTRRA